MSGSFEFEINFNDFDVTILPENARKIGSGKFVESLVKFLEDQFNKHEGWSEIFVDENAKKVKIKWGNGPSQPTKMDEALEYLRAGNYKLALPILETLRHSDPTNYAIYYNLGMVFSDLGQLPKAIRYLEKSIFLEPRDSNSLVALGVAYARDNQPVLAIETLNKAIALSPKNPWAHRNLGGVLFKLGKIIEAENHFKKTTLENPSDAAGWVGLGRCKLASDDTEEADKYFIKAIDLDPFGPVGEEAKKERSNISKKNFKDPEESSERLDAVMYLLGALEKFENMSPKQIKDLGFEVAIIGMDGLNPNDPDRKYTLKNLPDRSFSGLHLLCLMYSAFKVIDPNVDLGFDLSKEYETAKLMFKKR
jgi:tetratricopeptide (TPR) repeat protein